MSTSLVTLSRHSGALAGGLGSFPLASAHYRTPTVSLAASDRHSEFGWGWYGYAPPEPIQCSTSCGLIARGHTKICFGENQLSPSLIGLSPLPSSHPSGFQPTPVRASTTCYGRFTLLKGRSPRLRVCRRQQKRPVQTRFRYGSGPEGLNLLPTSNSSGHNAKGTPSGDNAAEAACSLRPLVGTRFQVLFHSPPGVLFTFPSRYWCTIGHSGVFSLGGWSPRIPAGCLVSHGTRDPARGR